MTNDDNLCGVVYLSDESVELLEKANYKAKRDAIVNSNPNVNYYLLTSVISLLIYIVLMTAANINFTDIMVVQLPLIVIFALFLTYMTENNHSVSGYLVCLVLAVLLYLVEQSLSLCVIVVILTLLIMFYVDKIAHNSGDYRLGFKNSSGLRLKSKIEKSFSHIKYHVCLSAILLIAGILIAYFFPSLFQSVLQSTMQGLQDGASSITTEGLFINNASVAFMMILASILISIPTVYLLIYNGIVIGFVGIQVPISAFLAYTVPHGIFELTAIVLAGAVGFRLTQAFLEIANGIINSKVKFQEALNVAGDMIGDCIIPVVVIFIFLVIAAFIEANLTVPVGQILLGL